MRFELTDPSGAQADKTFESLQVTNGRQLPQVAFHVGGEIVPERARRVEPPVVDARIKAREQCLRQRRDGVQSGHLGERERQQAKHGRTAGQRLAHLGHELELLASRQNETSRGWVGVYHRLKVRGDLRRAPNLVDDGASLEALQEATWIFLCEAPRVGILQRDVRLVREQASTQCGLATLARPRQGHHRVLTRQLRGERRDVARNHDMRFHAYCAN